MTRTLLASLCFAAGIASGCSDSSPASDAQRDGLRRDGLKDGGLKDHSLTDGGAVCSPPFAAKTNAGKTCKAQSECGSDEACLPMKAGSTTGMCLGKCCRNEKNVQDPVNTCPVANAGKQLSVCAIGVQGPAGPASYMACGFVCSVTQGGQTTTYDCPDSTSFTCEVLDPKQPDIKFCMPK